MASKKEKYPVLPLRDIVVYPKMIVPLFVGREKSIRALQEVVDNDKNIVLATQKNAAVEEHLGHHSSAAETSRRNGQGSD